MQISDISRVRRWGNAGFLKERCGVVTHQLAILKTTCDGASGDFVAKANTKVTADIRLPLRLVSRAQGSLNDCLFCQEAESVQLPAINAQA